MMLGNAFRVQCTSPNRKNMAMLQGMVLTVGDDVWGAVFRIQSLPLSFPTTSSPLHYFLPPLPPPLFPSPPYALLYYLLPSLIISSTPSLPHCLSSYSLPLLTMHTHHHPVLFQFFGNVHCTLKA